MTGSSKPSVSSIFASMHIGTPPKRCVSSSCCFPGEELKDHLVLDLACGAGRYLPVLEAKGASALGMDLSPELLREAQTTLRVPRLARADMRRLPLPDQSVDWLLSLFTSFGYFEDFAAHQQLATEWARVARKGMVVDVPNPEFLIGGLVPSSQRSQEGLHIEESRRLESDPLRVLKTVCVSSPSGDRLLEYEERVMLFSPRELRLIFRTAGMRLAECYGDYDGSVFAEDRSPRQLSKWVREDGQR